MQLPRRKWHAKTAQKQQQPGFGTAEAAGGLGSLRDAQQQLQHRVGHFAAKFCDGHWAAGGPHMAAACVWWAQHHQQQQQRDVLSGNGCGL